MIKKSILFVIFICLVLLNILQTSAYSADTSSKQKAYSTTDYRVVKLRSFLSRHNSPLTEYAEYMIKQADIYEMDWKLIPAISGTESTFGKFIPYNSYNAYGWDNGTYIFSNWYDSINHITKSLHTGYISKGANSVSQIAPRYNPVTPDAWGSHVNFFMNGIENTPPFVSEVLEIPLAI